MKFLRIFCALLCVLLLVHVFNVVCFASYISATQNEVSTDVKVFANATIDQNFADNKVLVVLDENTSVINKIHSKTKFGSVDIKAIKDLTFMKNYKSQNEKAINVDNPLRSESNKAVELVNQEKFRQIISLELPIHSKSNVLQVIKQLEKIDGIVYVGPDYISRPSSMISNDPYSDELWGVEKIQAFDAWDIAEFSEVRIGVIDSGIANHSDLSGRIIEGWDFYNDNSVTTDDDSGHGTHVAGIIAAISNNGIGIAGVAQNVKLVPLQVTYDGEHAFDSEIIEAITYASDNGIPIINKSMCGGPYSYAREQAISQYDGLFVCGSGNVGVEISADQPVYDSLYECDNIISVANTTDQDVLNRKSNYGRIAVDIAAPGTSIISCYPESKCLNETCDSDTHLVNGYHNLTGTSMASPLVAGVAALMLGANPELNTLELKAILLNTVDRNDALIGKCVSGGRLNAYEAVRIAHGLANNTLSEEDINKAEYLFIPTYGSTVTEAGTEIIDYTDETFIIDKCVSGRENITLPQYFRGKSITGINRFAFDENTATTSVTIPATITPSRQAFNLCDTLNTVIFADGTTAIPQYMFYNCYNVTQVYVPNTVTSIGTDALHGAGVVFAQYDGYVYNYAFDGGYSVCGISGNSIGAYHENIYGYSHDITIPSTFFGTTITTIGGHAFDDADDIASVEIPSTVTTIGYRAFRNCDNLKSVFIPSSVTSISNSMSSTITEGSTNAVIYCPIGTYTYAYSQSTDATFVYMSLDNNTNTASVAGMKEGTGWSTELYLPESFMGYDITSIGANAFDDGIFTEYNVTKIYLPETVTSIGSNAFYSCANLTDIYIPSAETTFGTQCFSPYVTTGLTIHSILPSNAFIYAGSNNHSFMLI